MSIIGNSNTAITLSPSSPNVTITGAITGDAPITIHGTGGSYPVPAAVQGGPGATFDILNLGNIQGGGDGVGIVLAQPGILANTGIVEGAIGLLITGYSAGAYVHNTGLIDGFASLGTGIGISGPAGVNNAGSILAGKYAVFLYRGGNLTNTGRIDSGLEGAYLFEGGQIRNQGTIIGAGYAGLNVTQVSGNSTSLYNGPTGRIDGYLYGVLLQGATTPETITNAGYIGAVYDRYGARGTLGTRISYGRYDGLYLESGTVTNTGTITGRSNGVFAAAGPATIINQGLIAGKADVAVAIDLYAGGAIINHGTLAGGVQADAPATIQNAGLITGVVSSPNATALTIINQKTGTIGNRFVIAQGVIDNAGLIKFGIAGGGGPITIKNSGIIGNDANTGDVTYGINIQNGTARITNTGTISSFTEAIDLITAGTIINRGVIKNLDPSALGHAIELGAGSTLYNAGIIASADSTAVGFGRFGAAKNLLILAPTSTITGTAAVNGGVELTAGAGTLNLAGITGLYAVHFDAGSHWQLLGTLSPTVAIYNSGTLANPAGPGLTLAAPVYNYGLISGTSAGIVSAGAYAYNAGQVIASGPTGTGIVLTTPGYVINQGTIRAATGIALTSFASQAYNYGLISAAGTGIIDNGYVYNAGIIIAGGTGIYGAGTAINAGTIIAGTFGIEVGDVYNYGFISAATGVTLRASSVFYNYGVIAGGVTATAGGLLYNYAGATITSAAAALDNIDGPIAYNAGILIGADGIIDQAGTVTNLGTIQAATYAVDFTAYDTRNLLILAPTAVTTGAINLNGGMLDLLAARHKTGTLATAPANLAGITLAARANWDFAAPLTTPTLTNNGTILDRAGLAVTNNLTGAGTIILDSSLTLAAAAAQKLVFGPTPETLTLTSPTAFAATIQNFTLSDTIDLATIPLENITGETLARNILTLTEAVATFTFTFASLPLHDTFALTQSGAGTFLTLATPATLPLTHPATISALPAITLQP